MYINPKRLLRKPASAQKHCEERVKQSPSPDGRWVVATSHEWEPANGTWLCLVTLLDSSGEIIHRFEPLAGVPEKVSWSPDSRFFVTAAYYSSFMFLIYDTVEEAFSLIRVGNPYPLQARFKSAGEISLAVEESQLQQSNLGWDAEDKEVPLERYSAPPPMVFRLAEMTFYPQKKISSIPKVLKDMKEHQFALFRDGLWPFKGPPPRSTDQEFYGRQMEIFHLELFAEWGDPTAQKWLSEIQRISKGQHSKWDQVTKYLGVRKAG